MDSPVSVLVASPDAMLGNLAPIQGTATWIKGQKSYSEPFSAKQGGYAILRPPLRELGAAGPVTLLIEASSPVIACQHWFTDFTLYGSDMCRLLLREAGNWDSSARRIPWVITGFRFYLFPHTLHEGVNDPRVSPLLCSQLRKVPRATLEHLGLDEWDLKKVFPPEAEP